MDPFETRLKSLPLRRPSAEFGEPETLAALQRTNEPFTLLERIENMTWKSRIMAVMGLAASVLLAYLAISGGAGGSIAFAQVVEKLRSARTMSFDSLITRQDDGKILSQGRNRFMVPGKVRIEFHGDQGLQSYFVIDSQSGKMLTVDEKRRTAHLNKITGPKDKDFAGREIENVRSLSEENSNPVGSKVIGGVEARGFTIERDEEVTTIWSDPAGNPLEIEIVQKNKAEGPIRQLWTNIQLDEPIDHKLFSTKVPAGFAVKSLPAADFNKSRVQFVSEFLKIYTKHMDGNFPERLQEAMKELAEKIKPAEGEAPSDDLMQAVFNAAGMSSAINRSREGSDWRYYPGHKLGEKDEVVFWLFDKDGQYRAVLGDLSVKVVAPNELPAD